MAKESLISKVSCENYVGDLLRLANVVHKEFDPEGQTVNGQFYKDVMERLLKKIQSVRPGKATLDDWF